MECGLAHISQLRVCQGRETERAKQRLRASVFGLMLLYVIFLGPLDAVVQFRFNSVTFGEKGLGKKYKS